MTGSILFVKKDTYQVTATVDGMRIRSPFKVYAEERFLPRRIKLTLLGEKYDILTEVGGVLQEAVGLGSFKDVGLQVELLGIPGTCTDRELCDAVALTSMTDGGIYFYVWDALSGDLSEENLKFWMQHLSIKAPRAEVVFLVLHIDASLTDSLDLKPFQDINPNLKRALLVGSSYQSKPSSFVEQIKSIVQEVQLSQEVVWFKMEDLALKIKEKRDAGAETLSEQSLKSFAEECEINGEYHFTRAASYLKETGLGLITGGEEEYLILNEKWLKRNLLDVLKSCTQGSLDSDNLGKYF